MFDDINIFAPIAAAVAGFLLGWVWYLPKVFGGMMCPTGTMPNKEKSDCCSPRVLILAFIGYLIAAFAFAIFLGASPDISTAIRFSLFISIGWIATSLGINYLFSGRGLHAFVIDASYYIATFLVYAVIIGYWHS